MVEGYMANLADGVDLTAIPEEDKAMITSFSMTQKQIYADAAQAAADMIVNSYRKMHPELNIVTLRSNNLAGPGQFIIT